jgi:hypothetical protein
MAAPEFVPVAPLDDVRSYASPPRRPDSWRADRPGDLTAGQPDGDSFGRQGPDQGYALTLARQFAGKLTLDEGEHETDALAGCLGVALKRASLFGRAPVIFDLRVALTIWGFLDDRPVADLVARRRPLFAEVANPNHYSEQRRIVDMVPDAALAQPHTAVEAAHRADWRSLISEPA